MRVVDSVKQKSPIAKWADKVGWERRVKAVCKPCWELKYCPYGPLVEDFPLKKVQDESSCRIFGHDCPVFTMAEPFTETKELRRVDRKISRSTMLRVDRRDEGVCQICRKNISEGNRDYDHIIPWSKGGSSDESNIRLLCKHCNRKRQASFEDSLIGSVNDHLKSARKPVDYDLILALQTMMDFGVSFIHEKGLPPTAEDVKNSVLGINDLDEQTASIIFDMQLIFSEDKPAELKKAEFNALRYRWGFEDWQTHSVVQTLEKHKLAQVELFDVESRLLDRMGWTIKRDSKSMREWSET